MDPIIGGSLIAGGASILGGLLGDRSARSASQSNAAMQKEFAQHGVRWRVEDAKAAGLHPLSALGVNPSQFSPSYQTGEYGLGRGLADAGQSIGNAMSRSMTPIEKEAHHANLLAMQARADNDFAQAQYWRSRATTEGPYATGGTATAIPLSVSPQSLSPDLVEVVPREVPSFSSQRSGHAAGVTPLWMEVQDDAGRRWSVPFSPQGDIAESLEGFAPTAFTVLKNLKDFPGREIEHQLWNRARNKERIETYPPYIRKLMGR